MRFRFLRIVVVIHLLAGFAYAQGTRSTLSGTAKDNGGGVLPGVTVVVKNTQTGTTSTTVSNDKGVFSIPALDPGTYDVTLTLDGFKTAIAKNVAIIAGAPSNITVTMDLGAFGETVDVTAAASLVQQQSTTISTTMNADTLKALPFVTRNLMDSIPLLVGVDSAGASGDNRDARVNGLPGQSVAITMDGVSIKSAMGESDFYAYVFPTIDSIEQVTVTGATQGADSSGGSASVRFVTRGGGNQYHGSFFDYFRHPSLNTNYYFNKINDLPKNKLIVNQFGATVGGPILIPKLLKSRDRAFFFVSLEEFIQPISSTVTRTMLSSQAQSGLFRYNVTSGGVTTVREVNLYDLAKKNGQTSVGDAYTNRVLADIRATTAKTGLVRSTTNPNTEQFVYQPEAYNYNHLPAVRLDLNVLGNHRITGTYHRTVLDRGQGTGSSPATFPDLPVQSRYNSVRTAGSVTLRSTVGRSTVNELVVGWQNQTTQMGKGMTAAMFEAQNGFALTLPLGATSASSRTAYNNRRAPLRTIEEKLSTQRGTHSLSVGGSFQRIAADIYSYPLVPGVTFGVQTGLDPADAMFTTANFAGASNANLTDARALYGYLTGRVATITGNSALNPQTGKYQYQGQTSDNFHFFETAVFAQDQWRATKNVTVNAGLRYLAQFPVRAEVENYTMASFDDLCGVSGTGAGSLGRGCNLFKPGTLTGAVPTYELFTKKTRPFDPDLNNFAPNVGLAWKPSIETGLFRKLLGDPNEATLRASFSLSFNGEGAGLFQDVFGANPGRSVAATRSQANGNLVLAGQSWPVLFSDQSRLGPPAVCGAVITAACYPDALTIPFAATTANNLSVFDTKLHASYSRQYSIGLQRSLSRNTALEVRYVRTRSFGQITTENWNEVTAVENGFLDEFKLAQANLYANMAAGRGQTFAYAGPGTGTSPLPIFLASFNAVNASQAGTASRYTGTNWTSSTFIAFLNRLNPNPLGFASSGANGLYGNATLRQNGRTAGLPTNFWVLNPDVAAARFTSNSLDNAYDSLQIELRRRLSQGLQFTTSYSRSLQKTEELDSIHRERVMTYDPDHSPHAFKFLAAYEIPVGHNRKFGAGMGGLLNTLIGGWNVSATSRVQSGTGLRLSGVKLVGMDQKELQKAFKVRIDAATKTVYSLPQDIIDNTIKAFSSDVNGYTSGTPTGRYIAPASGPDCIQVYSGDCGERWINVRGPISSRLDLSFKKQVTLSKSGKRLELQFDVLNVFEAINFTPVFQASSSATINQITEGSTDPTQVFDPGGRLGQVVFRFVW